MARARKIPEPVPGYLDFFGMSRAPFARVSEPNQVFHAEQYSLLYGHLAAATEHNGQLLIVRGADGSGKTTLLNRYIASLDETVSFATFDQSCVDGTQFYCGLLRQLGFSDISGTLNELRHISREFLIHRALAKDPVLVMIDNAHLVSASIFEQLRWLSEVSANDQHVFSLVLTGNFDLARIMDSPAMRLMHFASRVDFSIRVFSEQETDDYVRHRLRMAGGEESAKIATEARPLVHRFSGGNPSLINRLCDALLAEALVQKTRVVSETLTREVADKHQFVPHVLPVQGQGRRKTDRGTIPLVVNTDSEERISARAEPSSKAARDFAAEHNDADTAIEKLLAQMTRLSDELDASRSSTQKALIDVDVRDGDINALLDKVTQQAKELEHAVRAEQEGKQQIEHLEHDLQQNKQLAADLQDQLKVEQRTLKKTQTDLTKTSRKLSRVEDRKAALQDTVKQLKTEQKQHAGSTRRERKTLDKKLVSLEQTVASLRDERDALRSDAEITAELRGVLAAKDADLEASRAALLNTEKALEETRATEAAKDATLNELQAALDGKEATIAELHEALTARDKALDELQAVVNGDEAVAEELQATLAASEATVQELRATLSASDATVEELQAALDGREETIAELRTTLAANEPLVEELRAELQARAQQQEAEEQKSRASARRKQKSLDKEIAELHKTIGALHVERDALRADAAATKQLQENLAAGEATNAELQAEVRALQDKERSERKRTAAAARRNQKAWEKEAAGLQQTIAGLQTECDRLRAEADDAAKLRAALAERNETLAALQDERNPAAIDDQATGEQPARRDSEALADADTPLDEDAYVGGIAAVAVFRKGELQQQMTLDPRAKRIMIGRGDDSELCLQSKFVSRHHALIFLTGSEAYIEDLRSYNGTLVNAQRVSRSPLTPGDKISIGDFELELRTG